MDMGEIKKFSKLCDMERQENCGSVSDILWLGWSRIPSVQQASRTGRRILREILCSEYGIRLEKEQESVAIAAEGKPFLSRHPEIFFNISHSGEYAACAVGRIPVGIDIQFRKPGDHRKLARRILTSEEWTAYETSGCDEQIFYTFWTKKESYLKYTGEGIRKELRTLTYENCRFYEWNPWPEYSGMICVPDSWKGKIKSRELPPD